MNKVRRWNVEPDEQDGPCRLWNVECEDGEFVEYEDYVKLERDNERLRLALREKRKGVVKFKVIKMHELICLSVVIVACYFLVDWILK